ncbi:hypothetical protein DE146DRAFT_190064 [Phaeosphaeria sp. MPI-PUGE-AT-0046c]|nr:hypothetical protein DE146DRAFT_190064 [Phaeosphaeria sp. MPI-PUGE-AT-0046c]
MTAMSLFTTCLVRTAETRSQCMRWRPSGARCYSASPASSSDPEWFQTLRNEMLNRPTVSYRENVHVETDEKLANSLSTFLPREWCRRRRPAGSILPLGHSLVYFNTAMPVDQLLPDGTDPLQSPGEPWTRRMWAGGSMELNTEQYYHANRGFTAGSDMICAERIQDVQLRGHGDAVKIFVTLHRRFARWDSLHGQDAPQASFEQQLHSDEWGKALLKEERNLVFLTDKTAAEHESIRAGQFVPVRYLESPGNPDFSHTLTPTRSLLFRYSALTLNAHLIHLDREYARNVEGHRNLLVHGPLSLTLMLHAICGHVKAKTKNRRIVESIRYRNLAPLYCDEEMRICGAMKNSLPTGDVYDIWIEGPTGGVAVKGTVRTVPKPRPIMPQFQHRPQGDRIKPSSYPSSGRDESIGRAKSTRGATRAPPEHHRPTKSAHEARKMSELNVALGLDDRTRPNSTEQPETAADEPRKGD